MTLAPPPRRALDCRAFLDAAAAGDVAVVDAWLRRRDSDVNATMGEGWTALMYAVARGHKPVVARLLLQPTLDLNTTTLYGRRIANCNAVHALTACMRAGLAHPRCRLR